MNMHIPDIGGAIEDRLNALVFSGSKISIHTRTGEVGGVDRTDLLRGKVIIKTSGDKTIEIKGRDVDILDGPLS